MIITQRMNDPIVVWSILPDRSNFQIARGWGFDVAPYGSITQGPTSGAYWNGGQVTMIESEAERQSAPTMSVLTREPLQMRDVLLRLDQLPVGIPYFEPPLVQDLQEVVEVKRTHSLLGGVFYRNTIRPVFGQMMEQVRVYLTRANFDDPRSPTWTVSKGSMIYEGVASVKSVGDRSNDFFAGGHIVATQMEVIFPLGKMTPFGLLGTAIIIEWDSPYGMVTIDALTPVSAPRESPLWIKTSGTFRAPDPGGLS